MIALRCWFGALAILLLWHNTVLAQNAETLHDSDEALLLTARAQLAGNEPARAVEVLQTVLNRNPGDLQAFRLLQQAQVQRAEQASVCVTADGATAIDACQRALLGGTTDEFRLIARLFDLSILAGDREQALVYLQLASDLRPNAPALNFMRRALERRYGERVAQYSNLPTERGRWR